MFQLELTKSLAAASFNALTLIAIEKDALGLAAMRLDNTSPGGRFEMSSLIREANALLPQSMPEAIRLFFATQHQIQDQKFDNAQDLGVYITARAFVIEERACIEPQDATATQQWIHALSELAVGYSYVIEAAKKLAEKGLIARRRTADLQAIVNRPDENTNRIKAKLYDKAMVFYTERHPPEKPQPKENPR